MNPSGWRSAGTCWTGSEWIWVWNESGFRLTGEWWSWRQAERGDVKVRINWSTVLNTPGKSGCQEYLTIFYQNTITVSPDVPPFLLWSSSGLRFFLSEIICFKTIKVDFQKFIPTQTSVYLFTVFSWIWQHKPLQTYHTHVYYNSHHSENTQLKKIIQGKKMDDVLSDGSPKKLLRCSSCDQNIRKSLSTRECLIKALFPVCVTPSGAGLINKMLSRAGLGEVKWNFKTDPPVRPCLWWRLETLLFQLWWEQDRKSTSVSIGSCFTEARRRQSVMRTTPQTREERGGKFNASSSKWGRRRGGAASLHHLKVVQDGHDVLRHEDVSRVDGHAEDGDQQGIWGGTSRRNTEGNSHGLTEAWMTQTVQKSVRKSLMFL